MLLFRSEENVLQWCKERNLVKRPLLNLDQLWALALEWYENRLSVDSRRPGAEEMVNIFLQLGLSGPFWDPKSDHWE